MESSIRRAEESNYQRHCETTPSDANAVFGQQSGATKDSKIASQWNTTYFSVICLSTTKFVAKPPSFKGWPRRKFGLLKQGGPQRHSVPKEIWRLHVSPKWQKKHTPFAKKTLCCQDTRLCCPSSTCRHPRLPLYHQPPAPIERTDSFFLACKTQGNEPHKQTTSVWPSWYMTCLLLKNHPCVYIHRTWE